MSSNLRVIQQAHTKLEELTISGDKFAALICGPSLYAGSSDRTGVDVLLICRDYSEGLRTHLLSADNNEFRFLAVDRNLIESDITNGALGDFLTDKLLYPYVPIMNGGYVEALGDEVKTRVVREEARELVIEYGELCRGLVAKPEFFGLSRMRTRARVFIPGMSDYLRFLDVKVKERNISTLRKAFKEAIRKLQGEIVEIDSQDNVTLLDLTVDKWLRDRGSKQVVDILEQGRKAFHSYVSHGRAIFLNLDLLAREIYWPLKLSFDNQIIRTHPEDPKNYLYLRTANGLSPINERASIEELITKIRPNRPITITPLAGVLNEVYLVASGRDRFVAKKFTDWHDFKWFTLNLVSFGSKIFAVSGKARMSNEYGVNRYLAKKRLNVPEIIHASLSDRMLLESYISGTALDEFVARAANERSLTPSQYRLAMSLGEVLGRIHEVEISIGDSKPENFVATQGDIYVVDLEQAGKRGDYAWDIAELLFYAGHYSSGPTPNRGLIEIITAFIEGYTREGNVSDLRRAAGVRYAKVFSMWTPAPVLLEISKILRGAS